MLEKKKNISKTASIQHGCLLQVNILIYLKKKYDVNFIYFLDENFMTMDVFSRRTWMKGICELWKEYDLVPKKKKDGTWDGLYWSGTSHATLCEPNILKLMGENGCAHLVYGYESFDDLILKLMGKGSTRKTNIRSFFWTLEAGIRPIPNQIIGFPTEDFESIKMQTVWLWPNIDAGSDDISKGLRMYREKYNPDYIHFYKNFEVQDYARLINNCKCLGKIANI